MKQARVVGLLVAAALVATPLVASAQKKPKHPKGEKPAAAAEAPKEINLDEPAPAADGAAAAGDAAAVPDPNAPVEDPGSPLGGDAAGELGDICKITPDACQTVDMEKAAQRDLNVQMYAVQQIYALRNNRFEITPYVGLTMNDQFVSHTALGVSLNFYITNVLAIGLNGNLYAPFNSVSDFNLQTSRAARIAQPITEYSWNANLNFEYVPAYGKFAGFSDFIFHYDFYVVGGVGAISTRPIAVVDPDNRTFDYEVKFPNFRLGGGLRIFFNRWFAATLEVSDYIFFEELENTQVASGSTNGVPNAQNPDTWLLPDKSFTNNVQAQVGVSFFLPPTWEYRLPK